LDIQQGDAGWLDDAFLADQLTRSITHFTEAIELEESLRTVTVRLTPTPIPVRAERVVTARGRAGK